MEKEKLKKLVAKGYSSRQIADRQNCSQTNVRHWLKKHGLKTIAPSGGKSDATFAEAKCKNCGCMFRYKISASTGVYCSTKCAGEGKRAESNKRIKKGLVSTPGILKRFLIETRGHKCEECGCKPIHNKKPLVLQLDHIDGDSDHNLPKNLRLLCPNCHSQTETYKKGIGRGYKKSRRAEYRRSHYAANYAGLA